MSVAGVPLTSFQLEEVRGLLDVCADEQAHSGERRPWGWLVHDGRRWRLHVSDPVDAADDLLHRAQYLIDEGVVVGRSGVAGARSLRALAAVVTS